MVAVITNAELYYIKLSEILVLNLYVTLGIHILRQ